jgi:spoIIIJ-associated protein
MPNQNEERNDVNAKSIQVQAKSVEEAVELGLTQLGLPQEEVKVEVLSEGKRGVFGLGAEEATVRLTPKETASVKTEDEATATSESIEEAVEIIEEIASTDIDEISDPDSVEAVAQQFLSGLLERMGIKAQVKVQEAPELAEPNEPPPLVLDVTGKDLGILIGRRSETLQVLQYMVRLMVSKHFNRWEPVIVDVESYRVRRRRSLQKMALKMADRAVSTDRRVVLEAMPAHERRLIHLALRDHPDVMTKSIGSDDNRKVTIIPK